MLSMVYIHYTIITNFVWSEYGLESYVDIYITSTDIFLKIFEFSGNLVYF